MTAIAMPKAKEVTRPKVSIIIPTRDGGAHLTARIDSINKNKSPNIELIIVDNGSKDERTVGYLRQLARSGSAKVLPYDMEFSYSKINNLAAEHASGELLCFLNDDTEVMSSG